MADTYLEQLEQVFRDGVTDLHDAAAKVFPHLPQDESFGIVMNTFNNGLLKGYWSIRVPGESLGANCVVAKPEQADFPIVEHERKREAFLVAVACVLDHYAYIMDSSINPDPQKTVMVPAILLEELQRAAQGFEPKITCIRHPDRVLADPRAPEASAWMTQKVYDRAKGAFVMHRYCPECAKKHARGELV